MLHRIVKSGYDFRDLSEVVLELETAPGNSARRKLVKTMKGMFASIL